MLGMKQRRIEQAKVIGGSSDFLVGQTHDLTDKNIFILVRTLNFPNKEITLSIVN